MRTQLKVGKSVTMKRHALVSLMVAGVLAISALVAMPLSALADDNGSVDMYRLYNRISHEHLYTKDAHEVNVLTRGDWNYEGTGWVAPGESNTPVYRLYNPALGDHHYTLDANEVKVLTSQHGWKSEGIAWYSSDAKTVPVYRQFNPILTVGSHNYTTDKNEYDINNVKNGWQAEGVAWHAVKLGNPKAAKPADTKLEPAGNPTNSTEGLSGNQNLSNQPLDPPTSPILTQSNGIVSIEWDGKLRPNAVSGQDYDPSSKFSHVCARYSSISKGVVSGLCDAGTLSGPGYLVIDMQDLEQDDIVEVELIAIDNIGNESVPSEKTRITLDFPIRREIQEAHTHANQIAEDLALERDETLNRLREVLF